MSGTLQSLEIPGGLTGDQLIQILNDRFRTIQAEVATPTQHADLDMNGYRILDLADAKNDQDAVNLRTVRKMLSVTPTASTAASATAVTSVTVQGNFAPREIALGSTPITVTPPSDAATPWTLILTQDSVGGRTAIFDSAYFVAASSLQSLLNLTADTYSVLIFSIRADGMFAISSIVTGVPIT